MTSRHLLGLLITLACVLAPLPGQALAWNQVAHEYINRQTSYGDLDDYVLAGTFPDLMGFGDKEVANRFHSPSPIDGGSPLTKLPWALSANFASLWLEITERSDLPVAEKNLYTLVARGWGGHIAADWIAHTWVPITDDPGLFVYHGIAETYADAYVMCCLGSHFDTVRRAPVSPKMLRGVLISHVLSDRALINASPEDLQLFKSTLLEALPTETALESKMKRWPSITLISPIAAQALCAAVTPTGIETWCETRGVPILLQEAIAAVRAWQANPTSHHQGATTSVPPLYKEEDSRPGGADPPPVVYSSTSEIGRIAGQRAHLPKSPLTAWRICTISWPGRR